MARGWAGMREIRAKRQKEARLVRRGCAARPAANETQTETKSDSGSASRQRFCSVGSYSRSTEGWRPKRNVTSTLPLQPRTNPRPKQRSSKQRCRGLARRAHRKANKMKLVETYQQQQQQIVCLSLSVASSGGAGRKWFTGQASRDKAAAAQGEIR